LDKGEILGANWIDADFKNIWKAYEESFQALNYSFFVGKNEIIEYENIKMTTSTLMFNGRPASENDKIELEKILKDFFVKALLKKRADEENDRQKKKRNSKID